MALGQAARGARAASRRRTAGAGPLLVASAVSGDGSTAADPSAAFTIPVTAQVGDVATVIIETAGSPTISAPAGWTLRAGPSSPAGGGTAWCYTRTLTAGDPGSTVTWSFSANQRACAILDVVRGVTETGILIGTPTVGTGTTVPTVGSVPAGAFFYVASAQRSGSTPPPDTSLPGYTQGTRSANNPASGATVSAESFYKIVGASGTYGGETATIANNPSGGAIYALALPAA